MDPSRCTCNSALIPTPDLSAIIAVHDSARVGSDHQRFSRRPVSAFLARIKRRTAGRSGLFYRKPWTRGWPPAACCIPCGNCIPMAFSPPPLAQDPRAYKLQFTLWNGATKVEADDPYRFPPLISEFDLHLHGEGTNYESYRTLGAHIVECEGVPGVRFAVWAPNAEVVSVVGDFNDWDERRHPMRLRTGGIWEFFMPAAAPVDQLQVRRAFARARVSPAEGRPVWIRVRVAAQDRAIGGRGSVHLSVGRPDVDGIARAQGLFERAGIDLRSASGLLAARSAQSYADVIASWRTNWSATPRIWATRISN